VQTNFNYINLQQVEKDEKKQSKKQDLAKVRAHNLLNEYVTTSFMSANEKFDTAMVFETQLDEAGMQTEQKKISQLMHKTMNKD
jgi:hypothetical protein